MSYLLDTNVVSELNKRVPDPRVRRWHAIASRDRMYLSVITLGEIRKGIERLRGRDTRRADGLAAWLDELVRTYGERVLGVDRAIAEAWGTMLATEDRVAVDTLLAATAAVHGLTLVTRNVRDFERRGVPLLDPFGSLP